MIEPKFKNEDKEKEENRINYKKMIDKGVIRVCRPQIGNTKKRS